MDGINYANQLQDARDNFKRDIRRNRESYEKNVDDLEEAHRYKQDKMSRTYADQKANLEERYTKNFNEIKDKSAEKIKRKTESFQDAIDFEREFFEKERTKSREGFQRKLATLNEEFDKAVSRQRTINQDVIKQQRDGFLDKIRDNTEQTEAHNKNLIDRFNRKENEVRNKLNEEKHDLIKAHQDQREEFIQDRTSSELALKQLQRNQIDQLRDVQADELRQRSEHFERTVEDRDNLQERQLSSVKENFNEATERLTKAQKDTIRRMNEEHKKTIKQNNKDHAIEKESLTRLMKNNAENRSDKYTGPNIKDIQRNSYESQISAYKRDIAGIKEKLKNQNELNQENIQEVLRARSLDHSDKAMQKDREQSSYITKLQDKQAQKLDELSTTYKLKAKIDEINREEKAIRKENRHRKQLNTQNKNFSSQFNATNKEHTETIEALKSSYRKKQSDFIEQTKRDVADQHIRMLDEHSQNIAKTETRYESRLDTQKENYEQVVGQLNDRIESLEKKLNKDSRYFNELLRNKENEANRTLNNEMVRMEQESNHRVRELKNDMLDKMKQMSHNSNIRLRKSTESYEDRIKNITDDFAKRVRTKDEENKKFVENLLRTHKLERENLITKYESRISDLLRTNEENLERLKSSYRNRNTNQPA